MEKEPVVASPMFDDLGVWVMEQGLREASVENLVQGYGQRLTAAGLAVHRITLGGMLLHPVFGALNVVWEAGHDTVVSNMIPRTELVSEEFRDSPFYCAAVEQIAFKRFPLAQSDLPVEFPIFKQFRGNGITDYLVFFETYGRSQNVLWADLPAGMEGVVLSVATKRVSGFSDFEIDYLRSLMRPLALAVKSTNTYQLARALLEPISAAFPAPGCLTAWSSAATVELSNACCFIAI